MNEHILLSNLYLRPHIFRTTEPNINDLARSGARRLRNYFSPVAPPPVSGPASDSSDVPPGEERVAGLGFSFR